ncbi:hypothetical protein LguiB_007894 [Lonicera macranthoides]
MKLWTALESGERLNHLCNVGGDIDDFGTSREELNLDPNFRSDPKKKETQSNQFRKFPSKIENYRKKLKIQRISDLQAAHYLISKFLGGFLILGIFGIIMSVIEL